MSVKLDTLPISIHIIFIVFYLSALVTSGAGGILLIQLRFERFVLRIGTSETVRANENQQIRGGFFAALLGVVDDFLLSHDGCSVHALLHCLSLSPVVSPRRRA